MARSARPAADIVIISAPGFAHGWVPLNVARITAFLKQQGFAARNLSLCVLFSDLVARKHRDLLALDKQLGEFGYTWHEIYFSCQLFGHAAPGDLIAQSLIDCELNRDIYHTQLGFEDGPREAPSPATVRRRTGRILRYCRIMEQFLARQLGAFDWSRTSVVAFSCVEAQFLTSLFLARRLKALRPGLRIVFGGPMFQPYNAAAIRGAFDEIDDVVVGEGEEPLARILAQPAAPKGEPIVRLAAPFSADRIGRGEAKLRSYPPPDYDDVTRSVVKRFSLTTYMGKGCSHWRCSFCGISERGQQVRSADDVFREIRTLVQRYRTTEVNFGDWEINGAPDQLERLCDLLIAEGIRLTAWAEINARNTSPALYRKMSQAGIESVQIGIESFSLSTLMKIKKPATVLDNIKALKWGAESGMRTVFFNILCNHPGAGSAEAEENYAVLRRIAHLLRPPVGFVLNEMELYQTSAMYAQAEHYGIHDVSDYDYYRRCYPAERLRHAIPVFNVNYRKHPVAAEWQRVSRFLDRIRQRPVVCSVQYTPGAAIVRDSRSGRPRRYRLGEPEAIILRRIGQSVTRAEEIPAVTGIPPEIADRSLNKLAALKLLMAERGRVLGLPVDLSAAQHNGDAGAERCEGSMAAE